jgi:hypothetical protein
MQFFASTPLFLIIADPELIPYIYFIKTPAQRWKPCALNALMRISCPARTLLRTKNWDLVQKAVPLHRTRQ